MEKSLTALSLIGLTAASSLPAFAYPAGMTPTMGLSSISRLTPGQSVSVLNSRVKFEL